MRLAIGTRLGPYEIVSAIGAGGMGEVYRAHDTRLDRDVAVKVLPAHLSADPSALARFEHEAKAVAALSHPNILGVFDAGREGPTAYVVTELLEGESLRERLAGGALPVRKAADFAAQIARGLAAAHEKGIVHRDLKPENVFVTADGHVKILDFGLARREPAPAAPGSVDAPTRLASTEPGVVLGTVVYMAPEQVRGQPVDHRADLFAFGAVLYEMLAGRKAFERETSAETMTAILKEEPPEFASIDAKIPVGLARLVQHCLEKRPEERFQSARDLAFDLQSVASASTTAAQPVLALAGRLRRWRLAAGAALVLAAISAAYGVGRFLERRAVQMPLTFRQLTFRPQGILRAAFAPDGETIIFSSVFGGDVPDLFMLRPEYPEPTPLGLPRTQLLAISSQGELAVLTGPECIAWRQCKGTLARVPLGGTGPRGVLDGVRDADWSPDGTQFAVVRSVEGRDRLEYPVGKTLYQSSGALSHVRVSPRGDLLALFEHPSHFDDRGFVIVIARNGARSVLTQEYDAIEGLAWSPAGNEVFFTAGSGRGIGDFQAYGVDLRGHTRPSVRSAGGISLHDISRTGRWLVTRDDRAIGILARAPSEKDERELSFLDGSWGPILSRDGRMLLFTEVSDSIRNNYAVYMRPTDGSAVVRLGEGAATGISPDGRWALAITQAPQAVVIYPMATGERRNLQRGSLVGYREARWFPDGKRILVCGNEQGKAARCYLQEVDGGLPRPVTPDGEDGLVSPDGQRVVVWRPGDVPVIYRIDSGARQAVPSALIDDRPIAWSDDAQSVLLTTSGHVPGRIDRVDLRTGKRELVREYAPPERTGMLQAVAHSVAADPGVYAYEYYRMRSMLFMVEGVR